MRVRFAPSPTGQLHVGGLKTALFNWVAARQFNGKFILRIEDTDQRRFDPDSIESITRSLQWLGLNWDEGPDVGGDYGPYVQSERSEIYAKYAERLLENGTAYLCDCTSEQLEQVRQRQRQNKQPPGYDGRCRERDRAEMEELRQRGNPLAMRLKVPPEGELSFMDVVHGEIKFDLSTITDFVIVKSDGLPTYHFAHVVDDYEMKISHVIRGEEWISSVPKHVLIHNFLSIDPPTYVHTPHLFGKDGNKLSKRHGAVSALEYQKGGYLPDAVFNFLSLLGASYGDDQEILSRQEIVAKFNMNKIQKHPAIFDHDKLHWLNGQHIRNCDDEQLTNHAIPFLEAPESEGGLPESVKRPLDRAYLQSVIPLIRERIQTLRDGADMLAFLFVNKIKYDPNLLVADKVSREETQNMLEKAREICTTTDDFAPPVLETAFRDAAAKGGLKVGRFFYPVRIAVTGRKVAPPLFDTLVALGRERVIERLQTAIELNMSKDRTIKAMDKAKKKLNLSNRTIFCNDNLEVLQGINNECIDLIYLDPPFNKNKKFTAPVGSSAEGASFSDIFRETDIKDEWVDSIREQNAELKFYLAGVKTFSNQYNYCYLVYMAIRLLECHRILKPTGSIYLHCDPTMSHHLKIVLDCIFGENMFRNEVVWNYGKWSNVSRYFQRNHDIILFYVKDTASDYTFNTPYVDKQRDVPYHTNVVKGEGQLLVYDAEKTSAETVGRYRSKGYSIVNVQNKGVAENDTWTYLRDKNLNILNSQSKERTGYPTQKPLALLERIITASSNPGDIVLDPFCGCATTCVAAEKLRRKWVGIDVSQKAYELVKKRLNNIPRELRNLEINYDDAVEFQTSPPKRTDTNGHFREEGYVYVLSNPKMVRSEGEHKYRYKIGVTTNVKSRLTNYQIGDPNRDYRFEFVHRSPYYREIEKYILDNFDKVGEWVSGDLEELQNAITEFNP